MSNSRTTFLDFPLDKELYVSKPLYHAKPPLRVLITDAGSKTCYCLIYKICTGYVFGPDQEVYIHMVNAKGVIDHKSVYLELQECGFHLLKGLVVSGSAKEVFKGVDVIVYNANMEKQSDLTYEEAIAQLIFRARYVMKNVMENCSMDVKIVVAGVSSKTSLLQVHIMHQLEPKFPAENFSAVTLLDEAIARANLAARLKTTTNKIKNITIWGMTCPDVTHATVRMLPPGDLGAEQEVDVPVQEALQDDNYLHGEFVEAIFRRKIIEEHVKNGKSLGSAIADHLRILFGGTKDGEIFSMGVVLPPCEMLTGSSGFAMSHPVNIKNQKWELRKDLKYSVRTHLVLIKTCESLTRDKLVLALGKATRKVLQLEADQNEVVQVGQRLEIIKLLSATPGVEMKYFVNTTSNKMQPKSNKEEEPNIRKSIIWDESHGSNKVEDFTRKSSIRFSLEDGKRIDRRGSILKNSIPEVVILPPIKGHPNN